MKHLNSVMKYTLKIKAKQERKINRIQGRFSIIVQNSLFVSRKVYFILKNIEPQQKKNSGNTVTKDKKIKIHSDIWVFSPL